MKYIFRSVSGLSVPGLSVPGLSVPGLSVPGLSVPGLSVLGLGLALVLTTLAFQNAFAADEVRPGRLPREVKDSLLPGLQMTVTDAAGKSDTSSLRMLSLRVNEGNSSTPFMAPGPFMARVVGYAKTRLRGAFTLSAEGTGRVRYSVNDELVGEFDLSLGQPKASPELSFAKGYNKLDIEYQSPPSGDAVLRFYWASNEFPREPIAPRVLFFDGSNTDYRRGKTLRDGRLLVARHNCLKCHEKPTGLAIWNGKGMPELDRDAPLLADLSQRVTPNWLVKWILDPQLMRTHTTMPSLIHGDTAETTANNIAAFLLDSKPHIISELRNSGTTGSADTKKGMVVYEDRGCIACHRFSAPNTDDEFNRLSLHFIAEKYRPGAIANFLSEPRKHYKWSRMPIVPLTIKETHQLEAYIRATAKGQLAEIRLGNVAEGKRAFSELGCIQCHRTDGDAAKANPKVKSWDDLAEGCLSEAEPSKAPDYDFPATDRTSIQEFLRTDGSSLKRFVSTEFTQRQIETLSCTACHQRDNDDGKFPYVLLEFGERGLAPDAIPSMTWVGEKLQPQWVEQLLLGKLTYRPRPHFRTRMPAFPTRGKHLAAGLTQQHGLGFEEDPRPEYDENLAAVGAQVAAMQTGLACHRCHAIGDKQAVAPMEARSTNLTYATTRLRHEFYLRWMTDPLRIDPATKMIKFAQDGKKTGLELHYEGDAEQQFKAVWHYLESLRKTPTK